MENIPPVVSRRSLYVSDLDGTLLASGCSLSARSREGLLKLLAADVPFTIATARGVVSIREILGDIPFKLPIICNNGAYIRDYATGRALQQNALDEEAAKEVLFLCETHDLEAFVTSNDGRRDWLTFNLIMNDGMQWFYDDRLRAADPRIVGYRHFSSVLKHKITCLTIIGTLPEVERLQHKIHEISGGRLQSNIMVNPYQRAFHWLTVQSVEATKGNALRWVAADQGVALRDVTVFGDQVNDISMFELAGRSCAMQFAVPALQAVAHQTIGSNDADAVIKFVEADWMMQ